MCPPLWLTSTYPLLNDVRFSIFSSLAKLIRPTGTKICANPVYQQTAQFLVNTVDTMLSSVGGGYALNEVDLLINQFYFPQEYAQEIQVPTQTPRILWAPPGTRNLILKSPSTQGCAASLGVPVGWATLFNLGYEVSDACTSIVAQTTDGTIIHARNLDFWAGMGFTDSLKDMAFIVTPPPPLSMLISSSDSHKLLSG